MRVPKVDGPNPARINGLDGSSEGSRVRASSKLGFSLCSGIGSGNLRTDTVRTIQCRGACPVKLTPRQVRLLRMIEKRDWPIGEPRMDWLDKRSAAKLIAVGMV